MPKQQTKTGSKAATRRGQKKVAAEPEEISAAAETEVSASGSPEAEVAEETWFDLCPRATRSDARSQRVELVMRDRELVQGLWRETGNDYAVMINGVVTACEQTMEGLAFTLAEETLKACGTHLIGVRIGETVQGYEFTVIAA
jgi:hypothetical protein